MRLQGKPFVAGSLPAVVCLRATEEVSGMHVCLTGDLALWSYWRGAYQEELMGAGCCGSSVLRSGSLQEPVLAEPNTAAVRDPGLQWLDRRGGPQPRRGILPAL